MINWLKYKWLYFTLSLIVLVPGIFSLVKWGLNLSIEFTGGTQFTISSSKISPEEIKTTLNDLSPEIISKSANQAVFKTNPISETELNTKLATTLAKDKDAKIQSFETVGAILGAETIKKTINALLISSVLLLIFISSSFKEFKFGISALIATLHDTLILLGTFSLLGHFFGIKVDILYVTAVLTILSFSVHDTIVVFDRIREIKKTMKGLSQEEIVNKAISDTMVRSLNNSLTIIFTLLAMYILGGESTKNFCLALLVGTITGTYSSTFTALPIFSLLSIQKKK